MADLFAYGKWLAALEVLLTILLLIAMVRRDLVKPYKVFFLFMAFQPLGRIAFLFLDPRTDTYAYSYIVRTPILWVISILVVYELYENVLADYRGIASFGRRVITVTFAIAVLFSVLTGRYDWNLSDHEPYPILRFYTFIDRGVTTAQVFFLLAMTVFLRWFPAPMKRNVHVHSAVLFFYFLSRSSSLLFHNLTGPQMTNITNLAILAASCMCLIAWIWYLSPERDDRPVTYRKVDQLEEQRVLDALRSVNSTLLGAARPRPKN